MEYLTAISLRSIVLAAAACVLLMLCRVKSPAARHAVWSLVTAGMLAIALAAATLPAVPVRVLRPIPAPSLVAAVPMILQPATPGPASRSFPWSLLYAAGLLVSSGRLAYGYLLTRRLLRSATRIAHFDDPVYESAQIAVPLTIAGNILLPSDWRTWDSAKLDAVLIHERTHVRRADWTVAALAAVTRSLYWFHPLAWWLERHLHTLAEQACDDASLAHVQRESYAQVLVDMAAAVRNTKHRVAWEAMAMAKGAEVRMRIERILDDTRPLSRPVTRARWAAMALTALPIILIAALARPAHVALAQEPPRPATPPAPAIVQQTPDAPHPQETRTDRVQQMLDRLHEQLRLQTMRMNLNKQLEYYRELAAAENAKVRDLNQRMVDTETQIAALQQMYTDASPQLKAAHARLALLRGERDSEMAARAGHKVLQDVEAAIERLNRQILEAAPIPDATTSPRLLSRRDPEYTPEARAAHLGGKVELTLTVGTDGVPTDIQVTRGLGAGLDEKALECVKLWRFNPATQSGSPIPAIILVEVPFRADRQ